MSTGTYIKKTHIQDNVHEYIAIDRKIKCMIDTPEFQRLRMVKQLGLTDYVYPSATHTRFSHSLGVQHLARKLITKIKQEQPELRITDDEIFAVSAAGLCHDLGHGPFSHSFEKVTHARHEDMSIKLIHQMRNNKQYLFQIINHNILDLICALVSPKTHPNIVQKYTSMGRGWLFDIVSNELNGIDVDKWDYLLRDSKHLAIPISFKYSRMVADCRVIDGHICYLDKCSNDIQLLFKSRYELFKQCYSHHTTAAVEYMMTDIFSLSEKHFGITKKAQNPKEFLNLDDTLIQMIKRTNVSQIKDNEARKGIIKAQRLIKRMDYHDFYKCAGYTLLPPELLPHSTNLKIEYDEIERKWKKRIFEILQTQIEHENKEDIVFDDIMVQLMPIGYGMEDRHPFENVLYYRASQPNKSFLLEIDQISLVAMDANKWKEVIFRVFVKNESWRKPVAKAFCVFEKEKQLIDTTPPRRAGAKADVESIHVSPKTIVYKEFKHFVPFKAPPSPSLLFNAHKQMDHQEQINQDIHHHKDIKCLASKLQRVTIELEEMEKHLQEKRREQETVMDELHAFSLRMKEMRTSYFTYGPNVNYNRSRQMNRLNVSPYHAHSHHHQHFYIKERSYENDRDYYTTNRRNQFNRKRYKNNRNSNWKQ